MRSTVKRPRPDKQALARGDADALAVAVTALAADLFGAADSSISFPLSMRDVARLAGRSPVHAGLLAAAIDLRVLLAQCPQGRQALRDFGFEPVLEHVEGE